MFCDSGCHDWIGPESEGGSSATEPSTEATPDETLDSEDPRREYNPPPVEDTPAVPPSPEAPVEPVAEPAEEFVPAVIFPPSTTAAPIGGMNSSVQASGWVR
jgi:hypothetical protein